MHKIYICLLSLVFCALANAASAACSTHSLGTSRILEIDSKKYSNFDGHEKSLGLKNKEVIFTFDDGPIAGKTNKVLQTLKEHCVRATFFAVGKMARAYPKLAKQIVRDGHTLAHHTVNHNRLPKYSIQNASKHINEGVRLVQKAAYGTTFDEPKVPFFRFPYLATNKATRNLVRQKNFISFGTNIDALDWKKNSPQTIVNRVMNRLVKQKKGIILMHDFHVRTTKALPILLKRLKAEGYKVVHMVPKKTIIDPSEELLIADLGRTQTGSNVDTSTDDIADLDIQYAAVSEDILPINADMISKKWAIRKTETLLNGFIIKTDEVYLEIEDDDYTQTAQKVDEELTTNSVIKPVSTNTASFGNQPLKDLALRSALSAF